VCAVRVMGTTKSDEGSSTFERTPHPHHDYSRAQALCDPNSSTTPYHRSYTLFVQPVRRTVALSPTNKDKLVRLT
jgi:hypothetical protein